LIGLQHQVLLEQLQENLENVTDQLTMIKSNCDKKQQLVWALKGRPMYYYSLPIM